MGKIESIITLSSLGLNTPVILDTLSERLSKEFKKSAWISLRTELSKLKNRRVSIRTEMKGRFKTPHFPNISLTKADKLVLNLIYEGYAVHIFEAIDPSLCLRRGNLVIRDGDISLEYLEGPGTVRDLEHSTSDKIKSLRFDLTGKYTSGPTNLFVLVQLLQERLEKLRGKILEWSQYSIPVGEKKEPIIFWEMRPWQ